MSLPVSVIHLEDTPQCASSLLDAAQTLGFVYITLQNSEIPAEKIDNMFELSKKFFSSPREEKEKCSISVDNKGWSSMHSEILDQNQRRGDFKEAINFGEFENSKAQQPIPTALTAHEPTLSEFTDLCHDLCLKLLRLIATALKIDTEAGGQDWFTSRHSRSLGPSGSTLRLLYYPSLPANSGYSPTLDFRAGAHSDYGSITLLFQRPGEPGLEIYHPSRGSWDPVPVLPNAVLVNIGDLLSYWTAGLLRSTIHRVTFPAMPRETPKDRYSIVYFCHPSNDTLLTPIPSEVVRQREERGANDTEKTLTAGDHLRGRLKATYGWKENGRNRDF